MTARIRRHSLAIHRGLLSKPAARRGAAVIVGAVVAGVMAAAPSAATPAAAAANGPDSTANAQGSVRSGNKATPGHVRGPDSTDSAQGGVGGNDNPGNKVSPQTRVPASNRACRCETPEPGSEARATQIAVRRARNGWPKVMSSHSPARSSIGRIVARDNGDGSRTVSDQHGSSTFSQALVEALQRATARRHAAPPPPPPPPGAPAPVSSGDTWTIVVGGFNDPDGKVFTGDVDAVVHYSAALTGASTREGVNELNRMIQEHRATHPGDHIKIVGYSQGAAVVHTWTSENQGMQNVNSVLIADPKRDAGPGAAGISGQPITQVVGAPTAGADRDFGNIPTVSVCTDDVICDSTARSGWGGYLAQPSAHGNYSFNVDDYSNTGNGQWFNGQFYPR